MAPPIISSRRNDPTRRRAGISHPVASIPTHPNEKSPVVVPGFAVFRSTRMPDFTIETTYRLPVYRHRTFNAETVEQACRLAIDDDDWAGERHDQESAGATFVSGVWPGADAAHHGKASAVPSEFGETTTRKADHFEILVGLLKVLAQDRDLDDQERSFWLPRANSAIAKAEAILAGAHDPDVGDTRPAEFVIARVINRYGDCDYLCGWDDDWGTVASLSLARALRFPDRVEADGACERARSLVPIFVDGRPIEYRVIPAPM
ncbi:MAG: hypothetical protein ACREDP_20600 [Bradyrhizobium sp.]